LWPLPSNQAARQHTTAKGQFFISENGKTDGNHSRSFTDRSRSERKQGKSAAELTQASGLRHALDESGILSSCASSAWLRRSAPPPPATTERDTGRGTMQSRGAARRCKEAPAVCVAPPVVLARRRRRANQRRGGRRAGRCERDVRSTSWMASLGVFFPHRMVQHNMHNLYKPWKAAQCT